MTSHTYFDDLDHSRLGAEYPSANAFIQRYVGMSADELRAIQNQRFTEVVKRAWSTPFYRDLWTTHGIEPGDIRSLDDLQQFPVYDKADIMADVGRHPPFGSMVAGGIESLNRPPIVFQTTSGTTGSPQPVLFGPWSREVANALVGRMFLLLGVGNSDVVHSVYGHGTVNGGHYLREAVNHFTRAIFVSAGTGVETPSKRQIALMEQFGATVLVGFADYLRRLAAVALESGIDPRNDLNIRMVIGHLPGGVRHRVESDWGCLAYDWYGVADTGCIAAEGPDRSGLHVWEDAHHVEILDSSGKPTATQEGDIVVTCLYKNDIAPVIRFNTHDRSGWISGGSPLDLPFGRISGFRGRSDSMVKIRGINIYPHAIGSALETDSHLTGEYICRAIRSADGREDLIVVLEHHQHENADQENYVGALSELLRITPVVELVPPGSTSALTEVDRRQKPIRLIDERT